MIKALTFNKALTHSPKRTQNIEEGFDSPRKADVEHDLVDVDEVAVLDHFPDVASDNITIAHNQFRQIKDFFLFKASHFPSELLKLKLISTFIVCK
jgi:hypothetical protein